jgi:endonuclease/exonuclease/phosphatase family metal-dependent hydrolase
MIWAIASMAPLMAEATASLSVQSLSPPAAAAAPAVGSAEISVLTYNVRGLPWPAARGRAAALREIGAELAQMRQEGRQPDVVLLQEGFRGEVADLVAASGYAYWAKGPGRPFAKLTGGGLHVLSDLPILSVRNTAYSACAGIDCLANKGAMLVRVALPDAPVEIDVVNTHMNARRAARAPIEATLRAHNRQMEQLIGFVSANTGPDRPLLVGGDFNVRNAPKRYDHQAKARPFAVVSEFCHQPRAACGDGGAAAAPWLRSQDLQGFASARGVEVRPQTTEAVFDGRQGDRLSDHDGYLVRYRLSWTPPSDATPQQARGLKVQPQFRQLGARVSWTY